MAYQLLREIQGAKNLENEGFSIDIALSEYELYYPMFVLTSTLAILYL